jgi:thiamine-phosphate pyrophosphorylase
LDSRVDKLWRTALYLSRRAGEGKTSGRSALRLLPPLLFVTDPVRTPDPAATASRLPRGAGVIYRGFGAPDALAVAQRLRDISWSRGLTLLIGADSRLAAAVHADGVHLPERLVACAPGLRLKRPNWILTGAAHNARALFAAHRAGLDAALVSPVFESLSPSAHGSLGPVRFADLVRQAQLPVYALGGVDGRTAKTLLSTGAVGVAAVAGLADG